MTRLRRLRRRCRRATVCAGAVLVSQQLTLFLLQTAVIVAASAVTRLVLRVARQPAVVADIAAGIVLGPSFLGWLSPELSSALFPSSSLGFVALFSQLGLIMFMFLVGLELDVDLLYGRGRSAFAISQTGILLPFVLGIGVSYPLHAHFAGDGTSRISFCLFMGVAMSITAFPVLARILGERGMVRTPTGAMALTCAAIDDVTAWCLLAVAVASAGMGEAFAAGATVVGTLLYLALMLVAGRPLLRRVIERLTTADVMSHGFLAALFFALLLSSWTTERIGIHALFGAFVFGVIVPKDKGIARAISAKLEDVVAVLFLPLFFALSGLRTQIGLLDSVDHVLLTLAIIAVACAGKIGGCTLAARLTGHTWRESTVLGILLNTRGLMELVVLNVGLELGVISPALFTMMVLMALVTTVMTSPLLDLLVARDARPT